MCPREPCVSHLLTVSLYSQYDDDASTYYTYELNAPDALTGPHILAQVGMAATMVAIAQPLRRSAAT